MKLTIRILFAAVILGAAGWFALDLLRPTEPTLPRAIVIEDAAEGKEAPRPDRSRNNDAERTRPRSERAQSDPEVPGGGAVPVAPGPPCPAGEDDPGEVEDDCDDGYEDLDRDEDPERDDTPDEGDGDN